jgi:transcriptional regulator with XRE-family HTH domain
VKLALMTAENLRAQRIAVGFKFKSEFARVAGINRNILDRLERGEKKLQARTH